MEPPKSAQRPIHRPADQPSVGADRWPFGTDLDATAREREYSPSSCLPDRDLDPFLHRYAADSAEARRHHRVEVVEYGAAETNTIDLFVPDGSGPTPPPLHVFIHGGYWQQLSKRESSFLAPACLERGWAFAAVDYTLAPAATLSDIVDECARALRALRARAADRGFDADRVVVSGSSAGAHLAARATQVLEVHERPAGLILVSGVYLLEPLIGTSINDAVGLDPASARSASPLLHPLDGFPPTVVAWGDNEPDEFKRQSRAMTDGLAAAAVPVVEVEIPARNHFDVLFDIVPDLTDRLPT